MQVVYIEYALLLLYVVFYHYIFALNLEITIKLSRATSQGYKKRVIVYHIISTVLTIILALLLISITYFQTDKEALSLDALGYDILAWYLICISGIVWIFIGIYFKKMIQTKSLGLLNLMILTVIVNIVLILGVVMPEIILYFELDNIVEDKIGWALLVMDGALGFIEFLVLIMNKKFFRFISSVIQQKKDKIVRDSIRKSQDTSRQRISSLLSEINRSDSGLDEDGGLLGDFFDHVTKKVKGI